MIQWGNQHLVSGQRHKNMWPRWAVNLSPRYGHLILIRSMATMLGNSAAVVVVVGTRPGAKLLAMIYKPWENQLLGFLFFSIWVWGSAGRLFGPPELRYEKHRNQLERETNGARQISGFATFHGKNRILCTIFVTRSLTARCQEMRLRLRLRVRFVINNLMLLLSTKA